MSADSFDQWCVIELFGHQRLAGLVTEATIGGCQFLRVDVPQVGERPAFTKLLGQGAIYGATIVSEAVARGIIEGLRSDPVNIYDIPALRQRRIGLTGADEEYEDPLSDG